MEKKLRKLLERPWIRRSTVKRLRSPCSAADAVSGVLLEEARRDIKVFLPLFGIYRALHLRRVWADIIVCKLTTTCVRHCSQKIYNFPIVSVQHGSTCFPRKLQTALCMRPTVEWRSLTHSILINLFIKLELNNFLLPLLLSIVFV